MKGLLMNFTINMLISCGNSLIFVLRINRPTGRIRGSFLRVKVPVVKLGLFFSIVENLYNLKYLPSRPTRFCRKKISPSPVTFSRNIIGSKKGRRMIRATLEKKISKIRCIFTFSHLSIYLSLCVQSQGSFC